MKNLAISLLLIAFAVSIAAAQVPYNSVLPNGPSRRAVVAEQIGLTNVTISYHRPAVNGREGQIWGNLVPKGFVDLGFGAGNPAPWRAGANENTVIEFDSDVMIEGRALAKGRYGFFIAYDPAESILIFSKKSDAWGSFFYDEKDDALRVKIKPQPLEKSVEWLKYEFSPQPPGAAIVALQWERLSFPFKIEVDALKQQFDLLLSESKNPRGFTSQGMTLAANWCLQNNYELAKGLEWAELAINGPGFGDPTSFNAHVIKAGLLDKLGRAADAKATIKAALPLGNALQLLQFGRQLITAKKPAEALEVLEFNLRKHPGQFLALVGIARGLSANGDYPKALEYLKQALPLSPNEPNKKNIEAMIEKLKAGKDIN